MKKRHALFLLAVGCVIGLFSAIPTRATIVSDYSLRLDEQTISRGYTVADPDGVMFTGVPAHCVTEPVIVNLRELSQDEYPAPDGLVFLSRLYQYDIQMSRPAPLLKPIMLRFPYAPETGQQPRLAFFNGVTNVWQRLPATFDPVRGEVRGISHLPFSRVAVFGVPYGSTGATAFLRTTAPPAVQSAAAIVIDEQSGIILYEKNADAVRPLASLTKLLTAMEVIDRQLDFSSVVALQPEDDAIGAKLYANTGETLTVKNLFYTMLIGSANNAAKALARETGLSRADFVAAMNARARQLGLMHTQFIDPTGLEVENQSTAREYLTVARQALRYPDILKASTTKAYDFTMINTGTLHHIKNTNRLIDTTLYLLGGKTGYLDESGYNLLTRARDRTTGRIVTALVLGASTRTQSEREVESLLRWGMKQDPIDS